MNKTIDIPQCCNCHGDIELDEECFKDFSINHLSGSSITTTCPNCGQRQSISPSIEWQTESVEDES